MAKLTEAEELELLELELLEEQSKGGQAQAPATREPEAAAMPMRPGDDLIKMMAPRSFATKPDDPLLKQAGAAGADVLSTVGRGLASLPSLVPGGESFGESFNRANGTREILGKDIPYLGGAKKFAEDIVRSPAAGVSGVGSKLAGPLVSKLPSLLRPAATGLAEALPSAAAGQAERVGEGGEFTPKEAALEIGAGVALPVLGQGLKAGGKALFQGALKPTKTALRRSGFSSDEIVGNAEKHGLIGDFGTVVKKATSKLDELDNSLDDVLAKSPAQIDADEAVQVLLEKVGARSPELQKNLPPGMFDKVESELGKVLDDMYAAGYTGKLDAQKATDLKRWLGTRAFAKGSQNLAEDAPAVLARELLYLGVMDEIAKQVPEAAVINRSMHEIMPIRTIVEEAIQRTGNRNRILTSSTLAGSFVGGSTGSLPAAIGTGLAARTLDATLGRGRGAQATYGLGSMLQQSSKLQPLISQVPDDPEERMRRLRQ